MAIRNNLVSNFLGQFWAAVMGVAFVPIYVVYLGVESYALIGFYTLLQGWLALLDFGMTPTMTREMARAQGGSHSGESIADLLRSLEIVYFIIAATMSASIWLCANWLSGEWFSTQALKPADIAGAISVMALLVGLRFCESIYRGALFGMQRQVWYNVVNALLLTIRYGGAAVIVVWVDRTISSFFWWQVAVSFSTIALFSVATHVCMPASRRRPRFSPTALRSIATFAGGVSLATLVGSVLTYADKMMISRLLSLTEFGHYMFAVTVVGLFPMLVWPVTASFYPTFALAVAQGDRREEMRLYQMASQLAAAFLAPAFAVCLFLPAQTVFAWTGDPTLSDQAGPLVRILAIGLVSNSLLQVPYMMQLAYGWTSLSVKVNCGAIVVLLPAEYWSATHYGAAGAALAWAMVNIAIVPTSMIVMHRRLLPGQFGNWIAFSVGAPLAASIVVVWPISKLMMAEASRLESLAIVLCAGIVAFFVTAAVLPDARRALFQLLGKISNVLPLFARRAD